MKLSPEPGSTSLAALTSKGQVVISSRIRRELALKRGQRFIERVQDGKVVLEPVQTPLELRGALKEMAQGRTTDQLIREVKKGWK